MTPKVLKTPQTKLASIAKIGGLLIATAFLTSCATHALPDIPGGAGFLKGLLHGFIAPVAFIVGLFTDARIYEIPNSGRWYDLGFMLGIGGFGSGIFYSGSRRRRN